MYHEQSFGATCSKEQTTFLVWSPPAFSMKVIVYDNYFVTDGSEYDMQKDDSGIWKLTLNGNYHGRYYNYKVNIAGIDRVTTDPYAKSTSINGDRGMIVDFALINPPGWEDHRNPTPIKPTEVIIYETHIRDFSIDEHSGMKYKGKYLAFTEEGTKVAEAEATGIDHLKELGITHLHVQPIQDFSSVDERLDKGYNWGYDPFLFHVPEGSYATNPYDGTARITELKRMIMRLHQKDIRIVMDVVFNHTYDIENNPFHILVPGYYYRTNEAGAYSNGSGCGNELATEKSMMRKFIIDCLRFWVEEYKIDGFRFDLMALMDTDTVLKINKELRAINPNILIYGEPWVGGASSLPYEKRFQKGCQKGTGIALFNDEFRNAIKGDNDGTGLGFVTGAQGLEHEIKKGIVGEIHYHDDLWGFAEVSGEAINYVSSHDNLTLYDKIRNACPQVSELELEKMNKLALSIVLTSQGIPFLHSGSEMLRSKQGNANSYCAGDDINKIEWSNKHKYRDTFLYIKGLISIRKNLKPMTIEQAGDTIKNLTFIDSPPNTVAYLLDSTDENCRRHIFIIHNANRHEIMTSLPLPGKWRILADGQQADLNGISECEAYSDEPITIAPISTYIMQKEQI